MKIVKLIPLALISMNIYAAPIASTTTVITQVQGGHVGEKLTLKSHHTYTITNDTLQPITFYVRNRLCPSDWPDKCADTGVCGGIAPPMQTIHREFDYSTVVQYYSPGQKYVFAESQITGAVKSDSTDNKYLTVN